MVTAEEQRIKKETCSFLQDRKPEDLYLALCPYKGLAEEKEAQAHSLLRQMLLEGISE